MRRLKRHLKLAPSFLTIDEAAAFAGVHRQTIKNKLWKKQLTKYRRPFTNEVLIDKNEIKNLHRPVLVRKRINKKRSKTS